MQLNKHERTCRTDCRANMVFPNSLLSPSAWHNLGLGLAGLNLSLGIFALSSPAGASKTMGIQPSTPEGNKINAKSMMFLGIRDAAAAGTMLWFGLNGKGPEMGALITSWTLVCVVDVWIASKGFSGWTDSGMIPLYIGSLVTVFTGLGLLQS